MSVNLQKGQRVDLAKSGDSLSKIVVGLGWDPVKESKSKSSGMFGGLFGGREADIDCDASALLLGENGKLIGPNYVVFYNNPCSDCKSVWSSGDNLTGGGDGDDEQIFVELSKVPAEVHKILFTVTIYDCISRKQQFGMIENAFIRVFNPANNQELIKYNLSENYSGKTGLLVGEIYRYKGGWKFAAIGEGTNDTSIVDVCNKYL
ncbi:TerD family protein [Clostridium lundense]|uniref:TerD family protein n=1 Tax=Clostridium lundense TaxID=319475 RepID=UPI0004864514|nr:TerD family protein [Clostridium lundense]